ncbi:hypothetical protein MIZ03_1071 [Rhodoferax lithotrophicus]|uniref:Uncharacterized protein n=1 Tax=Rhodoferax lithotrophicus TaxID=2798804 RepID=A0ABM7MIW0_9BURK|nr:hypothetical protein MIZ03_1071 [Rhodoferax sp. MIZ03]
MRRDDQNFNFPTHKPIENVVRETWYAKFANIWLKFNAKPIRGLADFIHSLIESRQTTCAKTMLTRLVVGDMLKVLNAGGFIEELTHLSKAFAWRRTSSAGMRLESP